MRKKIVEKPSGAALIAQERRRRENWGEVQSLVKRQSEDEGLWATTASAQTAYLQQELRRLHAAIEGLVS
jgi:hypothetical protein